MNIENLENEQAAQVADSESADLQNTDSENISESNNAESQNIDSVGVDSDSTDSENSESKNALKEAMDDIMLGRPYQFIDGIQNQKHIIERINEKINKLKSSTNENLSNETSGILSDILNESKILNSEFAKLDGFFNKSLSQQEVLFINKMLALQDAMFKANSQLQNLEKLHSELKKSPELIKQFESLDSEAKGAYENSLKTTKDDLDEAQNQLRATLSANNESLIGLIDDFLNKKQEQNSEFLDSQKSAFNEFTSSINEQINTISQNLNKLALGSKKFLIASLLIVGFFGALFGLFSGLTFHKYGEYKEIEAKFNSISQRLNGVRVIKDEKNNVLLSVPLDSEIITNSKEKIINLGGGK